MLEVRSIRVRPCASQDSNCFEAIAYWRGRAAFRIRNIGQGTAHQYEPLAGQREVEFRSVLAEVRAGIEPQTDGDGAPRNASDTLEAFIDRAIVQHCLARRFAVAARRHVLVALQDGRLYQIPHPGDADLQSVATRLLAEHPGAKILNLLPLAEALPLFTR